MTVKGKWLTILVCFLILLICSGVGASGRDSEKKTGTEITEYGDADFLKGASLGGVIGRMPTNSSKIFFESVTGRKLGSYKAYSNPDEVLYALRNGDIKAAWFTDVSAAYLLDTVDGLAELDTSGMADIENTDESRFEFAMAARNDDEGLELVENLNNALDYLEKYGTLEALTEKYICNAAECEPFTEKDMVIRDKLHKMYYYAAEPIYVGVTGAVPPIELLDESGRPYGFCVALMDEIGQVLKCQVNFIALDNETAFSSLMSGRVDVIFCYGAGRITTEGTKSWCMTRGYYPMQRYEFLYLAEQ